jgi:hypothetical protein
LNQYTLKKLKSKNLKNLKNQSHFPNNKHKCKFRLRKSLSKKKKNLKSLWPILKLGLTSKRRSQRSSNKLIWLRQDLWIRNKSQIFFMR